MQSVVIIGPAYPLRGGLASFDERLAREFQRQHDEVTIYTFSLQYPSFLFPGTSQYSTEPAPGGLNIKVCINSINPFNWIKVGNELKKLKPDIIVVRYWLPLMGPCFGTILRMVKKNHHTRIICIADNVLPHEKRVGDKQFTSYFIKPVDAFITMSDKVLNDLHAFTGKPAKKLVHPLYDNFGDKIDKATARKHLNLNVDDRIILFFGFIREYKGLDILLEAMALLKQSAVSNQPSAISNQQSAIPKLLVAGEFYNDRKLYDDIIEKHQLQPNILLHTNFIADSEVKYYLSAADFVIQPYRSATQSGVTPLAYHFEKPMLVTNVGGLPSLVPDEKVGLVAEPNAESIAQKIMQLYTWGEDHFLPYLREEKKKYSWAKLVEAIKRF
ncbi:glycosyltransferase [Parafilimonas sp.]|uniref:glycosyltransferase n=1 Tax=Parafilimonas sp. TaxID=1969739 RepID=UPI0039E36C0D